MSSDQLGSVIVLVSVKTIAFPIQSLDPSLFTRLIPCQGGFYGASNFVSRVDGNVKL